MKTPDDIKRGLECCCGDCFSGNKECPYDKDDLKENISCIRWMSSDALAYIQQLERERDAAIEDICQSCGTCKNLFKEKCTLNISGITDCKLCDSYEWRGVQEGD